MKYLIVLLISYFVLIGCAKVVTSMFVGPNGRQGVNMKCSGMGRTMDKCYQKASQLCPTGYNIIETIATGRQRSMAIECKE